ncbi:MAG TPA: hypothetical protein DD734_02675 [Firmicutes bacterium]|nr:hypothetical protein [Bacillota bacterium]
MAIDKWEILRRQNEALVRVYKDAYIELSKKLKHQVEKGLSTYHTEALVRDIQEIVRQLDEYTYDWLVANVPLAYEIGSEAAIQKLAQYGLPDISVSFGAVHLEAVRAIVQDTFQSVAGATGLMEDTLIKTLRDSAKGIFQEGMVTGETRKRLTKSLMLDLAEKGFTMFEDEDGRYIKLKDYIEFIAEDSWIGFVDAAGRKWDLLNYTEMLTRTKTAEAVSRGTENRLVENGLDLVMITSHGAEDWCRFYEGKVFSISGASQDYPLLSEAPNGGTPFHPRCRHRETPFIEKFENEETINRAKDLDKKYLGLNKDGHADQAALIEIERPLQLTAGDREALRFYTGDAYERLNAGLRGELPNYPYEQARKDAEPINNALLKLPKARATTHRVIDFEESDPRFKQFLSQHIPGDRVTYKAFTSTSLQPTIWGGDIQSTQNQKRVIIELKGKSGRNITKYSEFTDEKEVLFPLDSSFLVKDVTLTSTGNIKVVLEDLDNG